MVRRCVIVVGGYLALMLLAAKAQNATGVPSIVLAQSQVLDVEGFVKLVREATGHQVLIFGGGDGGRVFISTGTYSETELVPAFAAAQGLVPTRSEARWVLEPKRSSVDAGASAESRAVLADFAASQAQHVDLLAEGVPFALQSCLTREQKEYDTLSDEQRAYLRRLYGRAPDGEGYQATTGLPESADVADTDLQRAQLTFGLALSEMVLVWEDGGALYEGQELWSAVHGAVVWDNAGEVPPGAAP